jgi:predicted thioesterase
MAEPLRTGLTAEREHVVEPTDTAQAVGSGSLEVLATPRLLAWMESTTCAAVEAGLGEGQTSVGTRVAIEHTRASAVGAAVTVVAELVHADGRLLRFQVQASHADGVIVGHGEVTRVVVDVDRFLSRLS